MPETSCLETPPRVFSLGVVHVMHSAFGGLQLQGRHVNRREEVLQVKVEDVLMM